MNRTITFTDEEIDATLPQIGARIEDLKRQAEESNDFGRIMELVPFINNVQRFYDKLMNKRYE
jgi:hypothetical protein